MLTDPQKVFDKARRWRPATSRCCWSRLKRTNRWVSPSTEPFPGSCRGRRVAQLRLKGVPLGWLQAVLFDKDGTMSRSEPKLLALAEARILACLSQVGSGHRARLRDLLESAYGVRAGRIDPAGITAVASRDAQPDRHGNGFRPGGSWLA